MKNQPKDALRPANRDGRNCTTCKSHKIAGGDKCPRLGTKIDKTKVCDDYKPGLM